MNNGVVSPLRENPYPPQMPQNVQPVFGTARFPAIPYVPASDKTRSMGRKIRVAFFAAGLFVLFSYNGVYRLSNNLYAAFTGSPGDIFSESGCPTLKGVIVHASIFFFAIMYLL